MKPFLPTARAVNLILVVGFCALGYALYLRYLVIEQSSVSLACEGGLNTWLCMTRKLVIPLYRHSVLGFAAVAVAALHLLRPSLILFTLGVALSGLAVVLYNSGLAGLAVGLLIFSLARRAPAPE